MSKKKRAQHVCVIPEHTALFNGIPSAIVASYRGHPKVQEFDSAFARDFLLLTIAEGSGRRAVSVSKKSGARAFMISIRRELKKWTKGDAGLEALLRQYWKNIFKAVLKETVLLSSAAL
jgi:hypothetical protein